MKHIDALFDRMDAWRHLPSYQLERRADLFFSLYLPEVLETKLGFPVAERVVPEFPVRIGTIYPDIPIDKSYKIDYVALSACGEKAILVELKTEIRSINQKQNEYLAHASKAGFTALLEGVLKIFRATNSKRKYFALLELLESMGLLRIPGTLKDIMSSSSLQGATEASRDVEIVSNVKECVVVYVKPGICEGNDISFEEFSDVAGRHDDPLSKRFARSLLEWASVEAGHRKS